MLVVSLCIGLLQSFRFRGSRFSDPDSMENFFTGGRRLGAVPVGVSLCASFMSGVQGGMRAVVWTDVFQVIVMLSGFIVVFVHGTVLAGGPANVLQIANNGSRINFNDQSGSGSALHLLQDRETGQVGSFTVMGVVNGPLLGSFILGMFIPAANKPGVFSGVVVGFSLALWLAVGSSVYPPTPREMGVLHTSVDHCPSTNTTYNSTVITTPLPPLLPAEPAENQQGGFGDFYSISYLYFGALSTGASVLVGSVVSYLTGPTPRDSIQPGLLWWDLKPQHDAPQESPLIFRHCFIYTPHTWITSVCLIITITPVCLIITPICLIVTSVCLIVTSVCLIVTSVCLIVTSVCLTTDHVSHRSCLIITNRSVLIVTRPSPIVICLSHRHICLSHRHICLSHRHICLSHRHICLSHRHICLSPHHTELLRILCFIWMNILC
ncbi:Sodium/iodide cotransporter [Bagarius yarrelli]|uniref:Sodium/iodide cotransporter n=1 Tax=Bagarius yarrelli TaxID=175774 RepID=A0A556VW80_BAGYA|nr:Sodium/iodide cotransporter [Bagarius yarrelli]